MRPLFISSSIQRQKEKSMRAPCCRLWLAMALLPLFVNGDRQVIFELSEANFTSTLTSISSDYEWVLVEFYAHW